MKTILLIEDMPQLAAVIRRELRVSGYRVHHAAEGGIGLTLHRQHQPDVVILDWMLPDIDGLEVLRRLRQTAPTPVLMLTARDAEVDRVVGLELGADDYLTKPFSMRELLARVRALLRRVELIEQTLQADRTATEKIVQYGPLRLDAQAHQSTLNQQPLDLSRTEFRLLYLLLRHPGRAFSRDYLLDTVWGQEYVEGDRAVDNVILRLRRKLGPLGQEIETVWGVGYRWRDA